MTIFYYLFKKLVLSFFTSLVISYSIFFIFSLFSVLVEELLFIDVLILSALNALQIFVYIPSYILLSTFLLFLITLRSKNELIIIKEYIQLKNIIIFISPIFLIFSFFELNKDLITSKIEDLKYELIQNENINDLTIISKEDNKISSIILLKKIDLMKNSIDEYLHFLINDQDISKGEFSSNLKLEKDNLNATDITTYQNGSIIKNSKSKIIYKNVYDTINTSEKVIIIENNPYQENFMKYIILLIFYIVMYCCFSIIFFSKIMINRNFNKFKISSIILGLFTYNLIFPMINLESYQFLFQFIAMIILFLTFIQLKKYE